MNYRIAITLSVFLTSCGGFASAEIQKDTGLPPATVTMGEPDIRDANSEKRAERLRKEIREMKEMDEIIELVDSIEDAPEWEVR